MGLQGLFRSHIGVILEILGYTLGLCRDNGRESGNYYNEVM